MPTTDCSSPTTTRAVNEKRRPPLTTFATRLISTTRSWSSPYGLSRSRDRFRCCWSRAIRGISEGTRRSEAQARLPSAFGQSLDAAVELVPAAVEHAGLDAGLLGALPEHLAHALGLLHRLQAAQVGLGPVDRDERPARDVVDELGEDALVGAEHRQPRTLGGAAD